MVGKEDPMKRREKHILLLEVRLGGHHSVYLERIAAACAQAGHKLTIALAAADMTRPAMRRLRASFPSIDVIGMNDAEVDSAMHSSLGIAGREIGLRRMFAKAYSEVASKQHVDHVLLPYVDYCLHAMALLGSPFAGTTWSGVCMRPSFHLDASGVDAPKPSFSWVKEWLFLRLLRQKTLRRLFTIDEFLPGYAVSQGARKESIDYLPDPAELRGNHTRYSAREMFGIPQEKFVMLAYGTLDERKGLEPLLAAVASSVMERDVGLLLVGIQKPAIQSLLQSELASEISNQGRLWVADRFVDEEEEQAAFAAADAVWLGYQGHYAMSGVLVLAAQAGRPVVSTRDGLIGRYVREYGLGLVVQIVPEEISKAISRLRREGFSPPLRATEKFQAHSWNGFCTRIIEMLE